MDHINGMPVRRWLVMRVKALVVLDRRALEEVCLLRADHGLLPAAAGPRASPNTVQLELQRCSLGVWLVLVG